MADGRSQMASGNWCCLDTRQAAFHVDRYRMIRDENEAYKILKDADVDRKGISSHLSDRLHVTVAVSPWSAAVNRLRADRVPPVCCVIQLAWRGPLHTRSCVLSINNTRDMEHEDRASPRLVTV